MENTKYEILGKDPYELKDYKVRQLVKYVDDKDGDYCIIVKIDRIITVYSSAKDKLLYFDSDSMHKFCTFPDGTKFEKEI